VEKEVTGMKDLFTKRIATREILFLCGFFFAYASLLLASDPEWLMWAGPILLGAFPVEAAPAASLSAVPMDSLQAASYLILPGLLALVILVALRGDGRGFRRSRPAQSPADGRHGAVHSAPEHREAA
jgi:hypothetical protein